MPLFSYWGNTIEPPQAVKELSVILCPFKSNARSLVNAICLKQEKLDDLHSVLSLIAIVTSSFFTNLQMIELEAKFLPLTKQFQFFIKYEQEKRIRQLQETVRKDVLLTKVRWQN